MSMGRTEPPDPSKKLAPEEQASRVADANESAPTGQSNPTDESAPIDWSAALKEHDRWLRTIVYTRVGEAEAVDEVMQEVSIAAVAQKAPIQDPTKVAPWLYRLAVTQSLLYRRKIGRRKKLTDRYAQRKQPTEADHREVDPLGWLLADERRRLIRTALGRLPKKDAEILLLKYTEDWSYRDLVEHLGISESAVEARLHRARQKLRKELTALEVVETQR